MNSPGGIDVHDVRRQNSKLSDILTEFLSILSEEELDVGRIKELVKPLYAAYQELYRSGEDCCMERTIGDFRVACTDLFALIKTVFDDTDNPEIRDHCSNAVRNMLEASEKVASEVLMVADDASQSFDGMSTASGWDDSDAATLTIIREKDDEIRKLNKMLAQQNAEIKHLKESASNGSTPRMMMGLNASGCVDEDTMCISMSAEREEIEQMRAELHDQYNKLEEDKIKLRSAIEKISDFKRQNAEELVIIEEKRRELEALTEASVSVNPEAVATGTVEALGELFPEFKTLWESASEKTKEKYIKKVKKVVKNSETVQSEGTSKHHHRHRHQGHKKDSGRSPSSGDAARSNSGSSSKGVLATEPLPRIEDPNIIGLEGDDLDMIILAQASFAETFKRLCTDRTISTSLVDWSRMNTELELFKATLLKHSNYKDDALKSAAYRDKVVRKASEMSAFTIQMLTSIMAVLSLSTEEVVTRGESASAGMFRALEDIRQCFVDMFRAVADDTKELPSFSGVIKVCEKLLSEIIKVNFKDTAKSGANAELIEAGSHSEHLREKIILESVSAISDASVRIVKVLTLMMSSVCNLPFTSLDDKSKTPFWELVTWGHRLINLLAEIPPRFEIAKALKTIANLTKDIKEEDNSANVSVSKNTNSDEIDLWDEILGVKAAPACTFTEKGSPQYVSLNKLIEIITAPDDFGTDTVKAAVSTAMSFAEPQTFLSKLIERFNVPERINTDNMGIKIKNRVCIALQHYIEAQFEDFDERTLCILREFVTGPLTTFNRGFGTGLRNNLERRERVARQRLLVSQIPSTGVTVHAGCKPLLDLFMTSDVATIAEQMTLISTSIYASIKPKELLDLAWSKPKLQYRAPNVIHFQERTALLSQFVVILTLSRASPEERGEALTKILDVMGQLLKCNNFNDLMALYAGFANASINRLVASKALIDPKRLKFLKHCDKLLAPMGSFKYYRHALADAGFGSVPILSVVLSDLTFIDEGNPDTMNGGLINFEKRVLVHEKIVTLQKYQAYSPAFNISEPLYSALLALPSCSEGVMYDFSLIREPRKPAQPTIRAKSKKF